MITKVKRYSRGFSLVENLVAVGMISIGMVGVSYTYGSTFHRNAFVRAHSAMITDIDFKIDELRGLTFVQLLKKINNANPNAVVDGDSNTETVPATDGINSFVVTYTAEDFGGSAAPDAVRIGVEATQARSAAIGGPTPSTYNFETLLSGVN